MNWACFFGTMFVFSALIALAVYGCFYGRCADLQKRIKEAKDCACSWSTAWTQEHGKVLTFAREIDEWKGRYQNAVKLHGIRQNEDFIKIKGLEARVDDLDMSVRIAEQAYAALSSEYGAFLAKHKRSHKKGVKSCQSKS